MLLFNLQKIMEPTIQKNILPFITVTHLQRAPRKELKNIKTFKVVVSNNQEIGVLMNVNFFNKIIPESLDLQIKEELWELHDKKTIQTVEKARKIQEKKKTSTLKDYSAFMNKYKI